MWASPSPGHLVELNILNTENLTIYNALYGSTRICSRRLDESSISRGSCSSASVYVLDRARLKPGLHLWGRRLKPGPLLVLLVPCSN